MNAAHSPFPTHDRRARGVRRAALAAALVSLAVAPGAARASLRDFLGAVEEVLAEVEGTADAPDSLAAVRRRAERGDAPAKAEDGEPGETEIASLPDGGRRSRDTRPQPAWRCSDPATPSPAARADMDPAVRALRPAFALPDGTPPAVGIAVRPDDDLLSRSDPPADSAALRPEQLQ